MLLGMLTLEFDAAGIHFFLSPSLHLKLPPLWEDDLLDVICQMQLLSSRLTGFITGDGRKIRGNHRHP